jgi:hypothetical protein
LDGLKVYENKMLRRINSQEAGEICIIFTYSNIIAVIKSRELRWTGHVPGAEKCAKICRKT